MVSTAYQVIILMPSSLSLVWPWCTHTVYQVELPLPYTYHLVCLAVRMLLVLLVCGTQDGTSCAEVSRPVP